MVEQGLQGSESAVSGSDSNEGASVESVRAAPSGNGSLLVETKELPEPDGGSDTQCVRGLAYRDHCGFTTMFEDDDVDLGRQHVRRMD